jgi:hypothetical protein
MKIIQLIFLYKLALNNERKKTVLCPEKLFLNNLWTVTLQIKLGILINFQLNMHN